MSKNNPGTSKSSKKPAKQVKIEEVKEDQSEINEALDGIKALVEEPLNNVQSNKTKTKKKNDNIKKNFSTKNENNVHATSSFSNLFRRRRREKILAELLDQSDTLSNVPSEIFDAIIEHERNENISAMNIDDSIIYGIDRVMCLWSSFNFTRK